MHPLNNNASENIYKRGYERCISFAKTIARNGVITSGAGLSDIKRGLDDRRNNASNRGEIISFV